MPRPNSGLAPNLPQTGARPNRIRSPLARGLEWARIRQKIGWPPSPAAPAPSADTRSRNRRFGRVPQDNPPFGQRRDEFDDAVVSPIGTTVQSVSTQKALAGFASLSYDGKAVEYDHPFAATAAGKPAIYKMLIAPVRVNCTANSNRAATGNRRDTPRDVSERAGIPAGPIAKSTAAGTHRRGWHEISDKKRQRRGSRSPSIWT